MLIIRHREETTFRSVQWGRVQVEEDEEEEEKVEMEEEEEEVGM